jgi:transcriptional regulator with XRE-family HTH domain
LILIRKGEIFSRMATCGLSGAGLASVSGKSQPFVSQILNGQSVGPKTAKSIADALECEVLDIFDLKNGGMNYGN